VKPEGTTHQGGLVARGVRQLLRVGRRTSARDELSRPLATGCYARFLVAATQKIYHRQFFKGKIDDGHQS